MFDFNKLIDGIFGSPSPKPESASSKRAWLPEIEISPAFQTKIDREYLDFIAKLYLTAQKNEGLKEASQYWFIEEIAYYLRYCYPDLTLEEYDSILQQIVNASKKEGEK